MLLVCSATPPYCLWLSVTDDFPESTGVKRIIQALNANVWANAEMKDGGEGSYGIAACP